MFHYLLAGDFFTDYKKYSDFIDDLKKERNFNRFIEFVKGNAKEYPNSEFCRFSYDEIYGHLPTGEQVAPGLLVEK